MQQNNRRTSAIRFVVNDTLVCNYGTHKFASSDSTRLPWRMAPGVQVGYVTV
jgi:hypothetical protein